MKNSFSLAGIFLVSPLLVCLSACGTNTVIGADAGDADGAADADGAGGDLSLPDGGTALVVPAGTALCQMNHESAFPEGIFPKQRMTLRAGAVSLPDKAGETQMDLFERVELGGEGQLAEATGPGKLTSRIEEDYQGGFVCLFDYSQPYRLGAQSLTAGFGFWFRCPRAGVLGFPGDVVLESSAWPCGSTAGNSTGKVRATAQNGDAVEFGYVYYDGCRTIPPGWAGICPAYMGSPLRAEFTRGQEKYTVTDYFRLGLACVHHGSPRYFIVVFEQPVGGAHALALDDLGTSPADFIYLDADFSTLSTSPVNEITYE